MTEPSSPGPEPEPTAEARNIPGRLTERGGAALEWERLRERLAAAARSELGRTRVLTREPSADPAWIAEQQQRTSELREMLRVAGAFDFRGLLDPANLLDQARIEGAALEPTELLAILAHTERVDAWRLLVLTPPGNLKGNWPAVELLSAPLLDHDLGNLLRALRGKIEPDGSLADDASPELARIRRALARQHRVIEESLRKALAQLSEGGSTQSDLITVRGERFVIPVKAEFKRKLRGILHGSSSSGQTVYLEPMETVEQNNELARLLDDEQAEIHRILVAMTRAVALNAIPLTLGAEILSELDAHQSIATFAQQLECVRPTLRNHRPDRSHRLPESETELEIIAARHPLLELRLRAENASIVPLTIALPTGQRQMIISGPNTGGKSVALKTVGLLSVMAQAGVPVPAESARLPIFTGIFTDIGDAQSIEQNLSTFSAHIRNLDRIVQRADEHSLVLIDELGSATDPDEGAALAVAVAQHFLDAHVLSIITTHLTALKVYAARHAGRAQRRSRLRRNHTHPDLRTAPRRSRSLRRHQHRLAPRPRSRHRHERALAAHHATSRHLPLPRRTARAAHRRHRRTRRPRRNATQAR